MIELLHKQAAEIAAAGHSGWGNTMTEAAAEIERLREHSVILAATVEQVERERWQKQCAGKRHEGCNYVATCGSLCNKCGQLA